MLPPRLSVLLVLTGRLCGVSVNSQFSPAQNHRRKLHFRRRRDGNRRPPHPDDTDHIHGTDLSRIARKGTMTMTRNRMKWILLAAGALAIHALRASYHMEGPQHTAQTGVS